MIEYCRKKALEIPYERGRQRIYSVITDKKGKIVSEAANSYIKTHPRQARNAAKAGLPEKQCLHSELRAIIADKASRGYKITVARVDSKGNLKYAEPCCVCKIAIAESNIKIVEHSV